MSVLTWAQEVDCTTLQSEGWKPNCPMLQLASTHITNNPKGGYCHGLSHIHKNEWMGVSSFILCEKVLFTSSIIILEHCDNTICYKIENYNYFFFLWKETCTDRYSISWIQDTKPSSNRYRQLKRTPFSVRQSPIVPLNKQKLLNNIFRVSNNFSVANSKTVHFSRHFLQTSNCLHRWRCFGESK